MKALSRNTLGHKFKIYWPFAMCTIKENFSYKGRFYFFLLAQLLNVFLKYYLWAAIYQSSNKEQISGFTMKEMTVYIFFSFIASSMVKVKVSREIGYDVVEGSIAINLIKPISYKTKLFFSSFGQFVYQFFVPSLFIWIGFIVYEYITYGASSQDMYSVLFFFISVFFSFMILFFFEFCFGLIAFYTTYIWGMNYVKMIVLEFLSGQIIPLSFFPDSIQRVFEFLPFGSMNYVPVMIYMGKIAGADLWIALVKQIMWILLLWALSNVLWKKATRRLTVLGG